MQTKRELAVLVLACSIVLFSQGARCSNFSLNITVTSNSPLNCSTGLTYPGPAFVRVEYRWLERVNISLIPDQWSTLKTMTTDDDYNVTEHTLQSSDQDSVDSVQLRIVQPEHGGGLCNCWEISKLLVTFDGNSYFDLLNEIRTCYINSSRITINDTGPLQFCDGSAGEPRGVVFLPVTLDNGGQTEGCNMVVNGSALVDKQPPPMNCKDSNPRIELSYVLDLAPVGCDEIEDNNEGIEVSLGNWDRDGDWIPLAYHDHQLYTNNPTFRIRDYDVPYYNSTEVQSFKISVCGDDYLRDGLQIRWLQQVNFYTNFKRDKVTLDNVSISLVVNEISLSLLEDGFDQGYLSSNNWNKEIRNGGVSTDCSGGSDDHKIVFGLNCTTFGCEKRKTDASRIATTVPLNITRLLETFKDITTSTEEEVMTATTAPATSSIDSSLAEELESTISNVLSIINENDDLRAILQTPPVEAVTSLLDLVVRNGTEVDPGVVIYLLSDIVNQAARSINDSQQFGEIVLEVNDDLLKQSLITTQSSAIVGSTLLATIEQLAFNVLVPNENGLSTSNIELIVQEVEQDGNNDSYFTGIETTNGSIRVPTELVRMICNGTGPVTVVSEV